MINYQELLTEARFLDEKPANLHTMEDFFDDCGTCSCALGDIAARHGMVNNDLIDEKRLEEILGIEIAMEDELFYDQFSFLFSNEPTMLSGYTTTRFDETPQETAARIRKFVYYRLRKEEIFAEYNEGLQEGRHLYQGESNCVNALTY